MRVRRRPVSVRVGELTSEVQVTGRGDGSPEGRGPDEKLQPSWNDRERHLALERAMRRDECRTEARRFDG